MGQSHSYAYTEALRWYIEQGITDTLTAEPQDATAWLEKAAPPLQSPIPARPLKSETPEPAGQEQGAAPSFLGVAEARTEAVKLAASARTLEELREAIASFDGFSIRKTATNLVFSDGDPAADIMLVGEAPGAEEDRIGKPFVGASGQLLDKILLAVGLDRRSQEKGAHIYISNILNWRPPGNRNPTPSEIELALPFIERHIQLASPKILIFCGAVPAKALLDTEQGISRLRGRWHAYTPRTPELANFSGESVPALATYHPSYLLRTPAQKRHAWSDMLEIKNKINSL